MRFYTHQHRFYCGGDLHARYLHILDHDGNTRFDRYLPARADINRLAGIVPRRPARRAGA